MGKSNEGEVVLIITSVNDVEDLRDSLTNALDTVEELNLSDEDIAEGEFSLKVLKKEGTLMGKLEFKVSKEV